MNRYQEAFKNHPIKRKESKAAYFRRLSEDLGVSPRTLSTEYYKSRKEGKITQTEKEAFKYEFDRRVRILNSQLSEQKKLYQRALNDLDESEKRF